jgi:hypothetical protein
VKHPCGLAINRNPALKDALGIAGVRLATADQGSGVRRAAAAWMDTRDGVALADAAETP